MSTTVEMPILLFCDPDTTIHLDKYIEGSELVISCDSLGTAVNLDLTRGDVPGPTTYTITEPDHLFTPPTLSKNDGVDYYCIKYTRLIKLPIEYCPAPAGEGGDEECS